MKSCNVARIGCWLGAISALCSVLPAHAEGDSPLYRCPGDLYTNSLSAKEARPEMVKLRMSGSLLRLGTTRRRAGVGRIRIRRLRCDSINGEDIAIVQQ